jgi:hypothetical protein
VQQLGLTRVDFIKLDIENAEANALRGARETLAVFHPRVAVALENSKTRITYAREILGIMRDAFPGYEYECGACTNPQGDEDGAARGASLLRPVSSKRKQRLSVLVMGAG